MLLPPDTVITLPDGTAATLSTPAIVLAAPMVGTIGPALLEGFNGWALRGVDWSNEARQAMREVAHLAERVRSGEVRTPVVQTPTAEVFRPSNIDDMSTTIDLAAYAAREGISTGMAARRCREGKVPGAERVVHDTGWGWRIPA